MQRLGTRAGGIILAAGIAIVAACGGSSSSPSSNPTPGACTPSTNANTLVIQNNTICPSALTVTRGTQVTILNSDSRTHEMDSDPHPEHTDCPELNQIGFLEPGSEPAERQPEHRAQVRHARPLVAGHGVAEGDDHDSVGRRPLRPMCYGA